VDAMETVKPTSYIVRYKDTYKYEYKYVVRPASCSFWRDVMGEVNAK